MQLGFIKLHRQMIEWEWYDDPNTMRLFIHCLLRANHKDNNWRGILIKRGSFLTSLDTLSKELKLSISQIRTSIKKLESTNEIASLSQARSRVITIVSYETYQANDKLSDKLVTSSSQASDKLIATNKNVKNEENEKNKQAEFDLVWNIYEKKGNKKTSQLKFNKLPDAKKKLMAEHLPKYVQSTPDKQFRKNLEGYITKECWNDEIVENNNDKNQIDSRSYQTATDRARSDGARLLAEQRAAQEEEQANTQDYPFIQHNV